MQACGPGVLRQILSDHWSAVKSRVLSRLPPLVASAAEDAVEKALRCGTEQMGFAQEPFYRDVVVTIFGSHDLDRDLPAEVGILPGEHDAHPART